MDISDDEAENLFGDDRERDLDAIESYHLGITQRANGIELRPGESTHQLRQSQVDELKGHCGVETIWGILSDKVKVVEFLQDNIDGN